MAMWKYCALRVPFHINIKHDVQYIVYYSQYFFSDYGSKRAQSQLNK